MDSICSLCGGNKPLKESHIIPSFVGNWLKKTSATGYLRQVVNPNIRKQDITKQKLLCGECELSFSVHENKFAKNVFVPYVYTELDNWSVAQGIIKEIAYEKWLLKFIISLQWRSVILYNWKDLKVDKPTNDIFQEKIEKVKISWKNYLLGKQTEPGKTSNYILFLQNLSAGEGTLPPNIHPKVNSYLCRAIDTTIAYSRNSIFLFTKLGPIVIISAIIPSFLSGMDDSIVYKQGKLKTAQRLSNTLVNQFLFIDRPRESMDLYKVSENQQKKIEADVIKNVGKGKGINPVLVGYSDFIMSKKQSDKAV